MGHEKQETMIGYLLSYMQQNWLAASGSTFATGVLLNVSTPDLHNSVALWLNFTVSSVGILLALLGCIAKFIEIRDKIRSRKP